MKRTYRPTEVRSIRRSGQAGRGGPEGFTLVELTVVLVIMGVLMSLAIPRFSRSLESARADIAGANLRAIWTAERIYWLEHRVYTASLETLVTEKLLDPSIPTDTFYHYQVASADAVGFSAQAQRSGGASWGGTFSIDQEGVFQGWLAKSGESNIVAGFQ